MKVCGWLALGLVMLTPVESLGAWKAPGGARDLSGALSVGLDGAGVSLVLCRAEHAGKWQLGTVTHEHCIHRAKHRDVVHTEFQIFQGGLTTHWRGGGSHRDPRDAVELAFGDRSIHLCRVRTGARTHVGQLTKKGCSLTMGGAASRSYELLVDPEQGVRLARRGELSRVDALTQHVQALVDYARRGETKARDLRRLLDRIPRELAAAQRSYQRLIAQCPSSFKAAIQAHGARTFVPAMDALRLLRGGLLRRSVSEGVFERCSALASEIRTTTRVFTSNSAASRSLPARKRLGVLQKLQDRLNRERRRLSELAGRPTLDRVEALFRGLDEELAAAVFHTQPWLSAGDRLEVLRAFFKGLDLWKPSSAGQGRQRLLELFHANDTAEDVALAVDDWVLLLEHIASSLELGDLSGLPAMGARAVGGAHGRKLAANFTRNGFQWRLSPPGAGDAIATITPSLDWIRRSLDQKVPKGVVDRLTCLRLHGDTRYSLVDQLQSCGDAMRSMTRGRLRDRLSREVSRIIRVQGAALPARDCRAIVDKVGDRAMARALAAKCRAEGRTHTDLHAGLAKKIRQAARQGRLRAAERSLKLFASRHPGEPEIHALNYALRRARTVQAQRLSPSKYARRLQGIESRLGTVESQCSRSARNYRRARRQMRRASRQGQHGRVAELRGPHDRAFYLGCSARDEVLELLQAQDDAGLSQAARGTRESAQSCLADWDVCTTIQ